MNCNRGNCQYTSCTHCDPETHHELHKERLAADESDKVVRTQAPPVQGPLDIIIGGHHLGTIDPNTRMMTDVPAKLTFAQFEYLNSFYQVIKNT